MSSRETHRDESLMMHDKHTLLRFHCYLDTVLILKFISQIIHCQIYFQIHRQIHYRSHFWFHHEMNLVLNHH